MTPRRYPDPTPEPDDFDDLYEGADDADLDPDGEDPEALVDDYDRDGLQLDLAERLSLKRVAGMSTQVEDISEVEYRDLQLERVVLISVWTGGSEQDAENAMTELKALAETAGAQVLEGLIQRRKSPDPATYIGRGKVDELREVVVATGADTVICDGELQPAQLRNLEDKVKVKVIDRTALILDIFAQHAKSVEGKTQVELAQLQYLRQRLRGWGGNLSRQAGGRAAGGAGIGGRGPGETKIETDRRRINTRVAILRKRMRDLDATRENKRADRKRNRIPSIAIVGYTNAGKSSLLNRLTDAGVLVEDALFATLDPTTRRHTTPDGRVYTLTDTVGFVRHLPHDLVESFKSTLEESAQANLLLHVVDGSDADPVGQIQAVRTVLNDIDAGDVPEQLVINKTDQASTEALYALRTQFPEAIFVSARTGQGVDQLRAVAESRLPSPEISVDVLIPYERGDLMDKIHKHGQLITLEHTGEGTRVVARVHPELGGELKPFQVTTG
ncbi:GTPase HflX [Luteococcus japonicus]|uniref:GTPase HflX n=1 Tax=Luteococcus japonicus LSP_Lj1 TaxID=1255658 RepID=A0A1R4JSU3_9ACTN|nr:GTPase HflX [Luteococcus japonicus]SJN35087.1 GTP-binding protein HflX [Luteococcus japonicus LSP_Lj1]